jgi:peptide/nickel transport system substrate-binding protein
VRNTRPTGRSGRFLAAAVISLGLIAAACDNKKDEDSGGSSTEATTGATTGETAPGETTPAPETTEPAPTKDPVYGGTLVVSGEAEVANPWIPSKMNCDSYCQQRARSFYDPLMALNADNELVGVLVESWESNDDFTEWTFTLRPGIKFHDGTPLDAAAAVRNIQDSAAGLLLGAALKDYGKLCAGVPCTAAQLTDGAVVKTSAVEATGDLTFTIKTGFSGDLSQPMPWPGLPYSLATQVGLIASPTWLDAALADPTKATMAIGTGPFIVKSYSAGDKLVVERNPDYWQSDAAGNQLPYLDGIEYRVIEDSEIAGDALRSGDIDIFSTSAALVISDFREEADQFPMREQDKFTETNYILIDLAKPGPLQDKRVRCALSMAINREELIQATANGILQPANGLFSPGQEGYLEDNGGSTNFDPEAAKALIDEYEAETGEQVKISYGTTTSQINAQTAELYDGYWGDIGVDFEYVQVPQDSFITNALFGVPEFYAYGWRNHAGTRIDQQYFWWHSYNAAPDGQLALNFARINDPIVDENLEAARSALTPEESLAAAENVNRQMAGECYSIPTSWTLWGTPHKASIQGLGGYVLPDGSLSKDGAGFSGQFYTQALWLDPDA